MRIFDGAYDEDVRGVSRGELLALEVLSRVIFATRSLTTEELQYTPLGILDWGRTAFVCKGSLLGGNTARLVH